MVSNQKHKTTKAMLPRNARIVLVLLSFISILSCFIKSKSISLFRTNEEYLPGFCYLVVFEVLMCQGMPGGFTPAQGLLNFYVETYRFNGFAVWQMFGITELAQVIAC